MEVGVLGPLLVRVNGQLDVGGRKERGIVTALALRPGHHTPMSRLSELLWGDHPPRTAARTLQSHVARVRGVIGAERLLTEPAGYRLILEPEAVDAVRFEQALARVREHRSEKARSELSEALAAWRGEPLADLADHGAAAVERERLDELRRQVEEELASAMLEAGQAGEAVALLEQLVAAEPLRELRWGLLMRALYRMGRQADALRAFDRARTTLVEQLGIEPGPELQAIQRSVLDQREDLGFDTVDEPIGEDRGVVVALVTHCPPATWRHDPLRVAAAHVQLDDLLRDATSRHGGRHAGGHGSQVMAVLPDFGSGLEVARVMARHLEEDDDLDVLGAGGALVTGPLQWRRGLCIGPAAESAGRLAAAASPAAVLVVAPGAPSPSGTAEDGLRVLGDYVIRGEDGPVELSVIGGGAADGPVRTGFGGMVSVERPTSPLIGRDAALTELSGAIRRHRWVSVVGLAGVGKTRLTQEIGRPGWTESGDVITFIDLSSVLDETLLLPTLAQGLGASAVEGEPAMRAVARRLDEHGGLVILDNCEQVAGFLAPMLDQLLGLTSQARFLTTSRVPLGGTAEQVWPLEPLSASPGGPAAELFLARAQARDAGLADDQSVHETVAAICERLDGLPLAIELAAAWARTLSLDELAQRVRDDLTIVDNSPGAGERSLSQALAASHQLLDPADHHLLDVAGVFVDPFSVGDISALVPDLDEVDVLGGLDRLVAASFLTPAGMARPIRFRTLQTVRTWLAARRVEIDPEGRLARAHAKLFLARIAAARDPLRGPDGDRVASELAIQHGDLRRAIAWSLAHDIEAGAAALLALHRYFVLRSRHGEARALILGVLEEPQELEPATRADLLERSALLAYFTGEDLVRAAAELREAVLMHEEQGNTVRAIRGWVQLARQQSSYPAAMDIPGALEAAERGQSLLGDGPGAARDTIDLVRTGAFLFARRSTEGLDAARRGREGAEARADPSVAAQCRAAEGAHLAYLGRLDDGFGEMAGAWRTVSPLPSPVAPAMVAWLRGYAAVLCLDPLDAIDWFDRGLIDPRLAEIPVQARSLTANRRIAELLSGTPGPTPLQGPAARNAIVLDLVEHFCTGHWQEAETVALAVQSDLDARGNRNELVAVCWWAARSARHRGDVGRARRWLLRSLDADDPSDPSPYYELPVRAELAQLGVDPADNLARCREVLADRDFRGLAGRVALARAIAQDGGSSAFEEAAEIFSLYELPWDLIETYASWADVTLADGDLAQASELRSTAVAICERLDVAGPWRAMAEGGQ